MQSLSRLVAAGAGCALVVCAISSMACAATLPASAALPVDEPRPMGAKLDPLFAGGQTPTWAIVGDAALADPRVGVYVLFSSERDLSGVADRALAAVGGRVQSVLRSVPGVVAELPRSAVERLAARPEVRWVEAPLPNLSVTNFENRMVTQAAAVQASPYNLDGTGVTALVYDGGLPLLTHLDLAGRVTVIGGGGLSTHSTHTAGTLGGSGAATPARFYKGMAPNVRLLSAAVQASGGGLPLYNNPADLEADYSIAINTHNADLASNSLGTNVASNNQPCSLEGNYGMTDAIIDNVVRGALGRPLIVVWAAGNERDDGRCGTGYATIAPPAGAKNPIVVGAVNSNDESMTSFTGWGPTDDGRIKPDVVAPGCQIGGDGGVTSCAVDNNSAYASFCGTSMACPTVAGLAALIVQDYRAQFPAAPRPENSLVKMLLVHTARDLLNPGPDYQTGYGSAKVKDAIDLMRTSQFRTGLGVTTGQSRVVTFDVLPRDIEFRATLVWDDPAGAPLAARELVNDLDLVVTDPAGTRQYPWTLSPAAPSAPAVRTTADRLNNIEQVVVRGPLVGTWTIEVRGFDVPVPGTTGQTYSLGFSTRACPCDWNIDAVVNSQVFYDFASVF
ncbi:MAG: S8 family serine peptidase, partial [Phycisphaerales bacterium]